MRAYVVVTGPPASGKSTLAAALAVELDLPLLAKDTIKAGLAEVLGEMETRRLGTAAVRALLAVARDNGRGLLDSVWIDRPRVIRELADLPGPVVEVFCSCPRELLEERYAARGTGLERPDDERWNDATLSPVGGPWPVIEVDTSSPVDVRILGERIRARH